MADLLSIKQGASFSLGLEFITPARTPMDLTGCSVTAELRDGQNALVAELPIVLQPTLGLGSISVLNTSQWPLGYLRCDVRTASATAIVFSETFRVLVQRAVTQSCP